MFQHRANFWVLLGLVLLALVACAAPALNAPAPTAVATPIPAEQQRPPAPTTPPNAAASTAQPPAASNPAAWVFPSKDTAAFRTFRSRLVYAVALPDEGKQYTLMRMDAEVVAGEAEHDVLTQQDDTAEQIELIQVGENAWMRSAGSPWIMVSSDQIKQALSQPEDFVDDWKDMEGWEYVGAEQAEGQDVLHYTLNLSAYLQQADAEDWFYSAAANVPELQGATFALEDAKVDVYTLPDGMIFKTFYTFTGQATLPDGNTTKVEIHSTYEIFDINADIQITPPAEAGGLSEAPFTLPEGAKAIGGMQGIQMFQVPNTTVDAVITFLETNLPNEGFTVSGKMGDATNGYMLTVSGNGETFAVTVSPEGGDVVISIMGGG